MGSVEVQAAFRPQMHRCSNEVTFVAAADACIQRKDPASGVHALGAPPYGRTLSVCCLRPTERPSSVGKEQMQAATRVSGLMADSPSGYAVSASLVAPLTPRVQVCLSSGRLFEQHRRSQQARVQEDNTLPNGTFGYSRGAYSIGSRVALRFIEWTLGTEGTKTTGTTTVAALVPFQLHELKQRIPTTVHGTSSITRHRNLLMLRRR